MAANSSLAYSIASSIFISASSMMSAVTTGSIRGQSGLARHRPRSGSCVDGRTDLLTRDHIDDAAVVVEAEEDHRQPVVPGHADGGRVGHLQVAGQILVVAQLVELLGLRVLV